MRFGSDQVRRNLMSGLRGGAYSEIGNFPHPIGTFLDLGANVGMFSMAARFMNPGARIIAVEPNSFAYKLLQENVKNLDVETHRMALGNGERYYHVKGYTRSSLSVSFDRRGRGVNPSRMGEGIPSMPLADMIRSFQIEGSLFIKVDVEGAEDCLMELESEKVIRDSVGFHIEIHGTAKCNEMRRWMHSQFRVTHQFRFYRFRDAAQGTLVRVKRLET